MRDFQNDTWVDFHSHVLPGIDDGSQSVEESLRMLRESARQKVRVMVATPHFYAEQNTPEVFLARRTAAYEQLAQARANSGKTDELPRILCGAEVAYFMGLGNCEQLPELCIEGTNILLVEMPFCRWPSTTLQDVLQAKNRFGLRIVVAHIERYIDEQPSGTLDEMLDEGLLIQANAGSFLHWINRGKALRRVQAGKIHLLGSDCHNMTTRPPDLSQAAAVIEKKCGEQAVTALKENAWEVLESAGIRT